MKQTRLSMSLLLSIALAALACGVAPAPDDAEADGTAVSSDLTGGFPVGTRYVTTADVNLRNGPATTNTILEVIPSGAVVVSASANPRGVWYGVTYKGITGWVHGAYLKRDDTTSGGTGGTSPGTFCNASWEDAPGTADYTTINWYERSVGSEKARRLDRAQGATLQGSGKLGGAMCASAKLLAPCFAKVVAKQSARSPAFFRWAKTQGLDPARVMMAFAEQETQLGRLHDSCSAGSCNGVGMLQIISAYPSDTSTQTLGTSDVRWDGITYNVLTNLTYATRALSEKVSSFSPANLVELARAYNGNPNASIRLPYGTAVAKFYGDLGTCGL